MTQVKSYLLWQGRLVSLQFPYLQALFQQRPRHRMDEFEFRHPPMEREKRAKIFAPYDALDGYSASVKKKNIEYVEKVSLDESQLAELNRRLVILHGLTRTARLAKQNHVIVTVAYYVPCTDQHSFACGVRGQYLTVTGMLCKVDCDLTRTLLIDDTAVPFDDLLSVTAEDETLFQEPQQESVSFFSC